MTSTIKDILKYPLKEKKIDGIYDIPECIFREFNIDSSNMENIDLSLFKLKIIYDIPYMEEEYISYKYLMFFRDKFCCSIESDQSNYADIKFASLEIINELHQYLISVESTYYDVYEDMYDIIDLSDKFTGVIQRGGDIYYTILETKNSCCFQKNTQIFFITDEDVYEAVFLGFVDDDCRNYNDDMTIRIKKSGEILNVKSNYIFFKI